MDKVNQPPAGGSGPMRRGTFTDYSLLPTDAPMDMPVQSCEVGPAQPTHDRLTLPRAALLLLTSAATGAFAYQLYQVLSIVHLTVLQGVFLVLCTLCFGWIALGTSSTIIGFAAIMLSGRPKSPRPSAGPAVGVRTALLFPVYQEDAARVAATIEAMVNELTLLGADRQFDVFILSDSRLGESKARELRAVRFLRRRLQGRVPVYYRARTENIGKKAGNIADWVQRFGNAYQSFVILDADSIMSGELLLQLQLDMASNPRLGLLQTVPRLVGAATLFARLQQFAVAYYGPIVAAGFAAWHQESGNYWGHNAIVRTRAFAQAAGLPVLSGRPPFGGHIQSHDFVEAAFLRRIGWEVRMLPRALGSYEGCPPTLVDVAVRDRRWAQGNLQHVRVIGVRYLPWVSRLHLAMGTYAYLASALWALSLIVGIILSLQSAYTLPVYFPETKTLFPIWPVIDPNKALYLFIGTLVMVLLPKTLGIILGLTRLRVPLVRPRLHHFWMGAAIELLFSILIAPILMLTQTRAIIEIVSGKDAGWSLQRREGMTPQARQLLRLHVFHQLLGVVLGIICALASIYVLAWMSPIVLSLVLSFAISFFTSHRPRAWIANALATPETLTPPAVVAATQRALPGWTALLAKKQPEAR